MNRANKFLRIRLSLLMALLAVVAPSFAGPEQPAASAACNTVKFLNFSDSTYTTVVGECHHGCCQLWTCTGQVTFYQRIVYDFPCD